MEMGKRWRLVRGEPKELSGAPYLQGDGYGADRLVSGVITRAGLLGRGDENWCIFSLQVIDFKG